MLFRRTESNRVANKVAAFALEENEIHVWNWDAPIEVWDLLELKAIDCNFQHFI